MATSKNTKKATVETVEVKETAKKAVAEVAEVKETAKEATVEAEVKETAKKAPAKKTTAKKAETEEKKTTKKAATKKTTTKKADETKAEKKPAAKKPAMKVNMHVQFAYKDYEAETIYELAINDYVAAGNKKSSIKNLVAYVKAEDNKVYYVINDEYKGEVWL